APILSGTSQSVRDPAEGYLLTESLNLMKNNRRQVGARNATYKVLCTENVDPSSCQFYNLVEDPLEEFPLEVPAGCSGDGTATGPAWHYCRLAELIRTRSFFAMGR